MQTNHDLARVAGLIADPSRAVMLELLMDGSDRSIGELARAAGVALSTTSEHVASLERGGLIETERAGRHRLVRLRDASVASVLESLANLAGRPSDTEATTAMARLRSARTCYDHLAGRLGVGLAEALVDRGALVRDEDAFQIAPPGWAWFISIGIDVDHVTAGRRSVARACLDWTERRPHLAGSLGAALARRALELGWVVRLSGTRALLVTPEGRGFLEGAFGQAPGWARPGYRVVRPTEARPRHATVPAALEFRRSDLPSSKAGSGGEGSINR
jgi:DNA-binding transcriptional ArsR family regulator